MCSELDTPQSGRSTPHHPIKKKTPTANHKIAQLYPGEIRFSNCTRRKEALYQKKNSPQMRFIIIHITLKPFYPHLQSTLMITRNVHPHFYCFHYSARYVFIQVRKNIFFYVRSGQNIKRNTLKPHRRTDRLKPFCCRGSDCVLAFLPC